MNVVKAIREGTLGQCKLCLKVRCAQLLTYGDHAEEQREIPNRHSIGPIPRHQYLFSTTTTWSLCIMRFVFCGEPYTGECIPQSIGTRVRKLFNGLSASESSAEAGARTSTWYAPGSSFCPLGVLLGRKLGPSRGLIGAKSEG